MTPFRSRAFSIVLIAAVGLLFFRAVHPNRLSEWTFGDAQTVLAADNWREYGFSALSFLWFPQGYSSATAVLDDPALAHHAHGIHFNGRHYRAYTHYPSWYALPYGALACLGLDNPAFYRSVALAFSLLSLLFLYRFFRRHFTESMTQALVVMTLLYEGFLRYCDSLANFPCDMFFRCALLDTWTREVRGRSWYVAQGTLFYLLCMTSLDSVFFIPLFALLYDRLIRRRWLFQGYVVLFASGVLALGTQLAQNAHYFGSWQIALQDYARIAHFGAGGSLTGKEWSFGLFHAINAMLQRTLRLGPLTWPALLLWGYTAWKRRREEPATWALGLCLLLAGLGYSIVLSERSLGQRYLNYVLSPFAALFWVTLVLDLFSLARRQSRIVLTAMSTLVLIVTFHLYLRSVGTTLDIPPRARVDAEIASLFSSLGAKVARDRVYFELTHFLPHHGEGTQIAPGVELSARAPVLFAADADQLARDVHLIWKKTEAHGPVRFVTYVLIPSESIELTEEIHASMKRLGNSIEIVPVHHETWCHVFEIRVNRLA